MQRFRILLQPVRDYVVKIRTGFAEGWSDFWFSPRDPASLAMIRICAGLILLYVYLSCAPERLEFVGPTGWIDSQAVSELQDIGREEPTLSESFRKRWWGQSVWYQVQNDTVASILYWYLIVASLCFTVGWFSRTTNLLVLIGHLSFVHRSYVAWFGMDSILAMILLYLLIAPSGAAYSVDSGLRRRRDRRLGKAPSPSSASEQRNWQVNLAVRMIQIHMCVIYLCSGLAKLQGETWWDGTAVLRSLMGYELAPIDLRWLGGLSDTTLEWFLSLSVVATLVFEIGFVFLIWNHLLRPLMLVGAVFLHLNIAILMGLAGFGAIMMTGCIAFIAPESIRWVLQVLSTGGKNSTEDSVSEPLPSNATAM